MRNYKVTFKGLSPLLMHHDNIDWSDRVKAWLAEGKNSLLSVPGDDRAPGFSWLGNLYHDGSTTTIPANNLMSCFMAGGTQVPVPKGKHGKTFKSQTQSGMLVVEDQWPLLVRGKTIDIKPILALSNELDFEKHKAAAEKAGFSLFIARASMPSGSKHVRVRPKFDSWSAEGTIQVWDAQITTEILTKIIAIAGKEKGIGDWRPSSPTPGPHGRFTAKVVEI